MYYIIILIGVLLFYTVLNALSKNKKPLKRAFINMLSGVLALVAVNVIGTCFDFGLTISPLSLMISSCLGVPGVASMLIINTLL